MMLYQRLFFEFFKTGLFAVGGGMATIPFLYDMADATGWFTYNDLANMIAVGESTPGPIGVNMATYVGFVLRGIPGSLVASIAMVLPSCVIALLVARALQKFRQNPLVNSAFYGLRPASTALVAAAGISVVLIALVNVGGTGLALLNWKAIALAAVLLVLTHWVKFTKNLHPILFILASAVVGVVFKF